MAHLMEDLYMRKAWTPQVRFARSLTTQWWIERGRKTGKEANEAKEKREPQSEKKKGESQRNRSLTRNLQKTKQKNTPNNQLLKKKKHQEDARLLELVSLYGPKQWSIIASVSIRIAPRGSWIEKSTWVWRTARGKRKSGIRARRKSVVCRL